MRIYSNKGGNDIVFEFTEKKYENKIKSFKKFAPKFLQKFFKRKLKPSTVYFSYTKGYKTKDPPISYSRSIYPPLRPITLMNIVNFAIGDMDLEHDYVLREYDEVATGQINYYLREIVITFLYT